MMTTTDKVGGVVSKLLTIPDQGGMGVRYLPTLLIQFLCTAQSSTANIPTQTFYF